MATTIAATSTTTPPATASHNIVVERVRIRVNNVTVIPKRNTNFPSFTLACLPHQSPTPTPSSSNTKPYSSPSTKLYVSGLSFRTTEESLRNAFQKFGELVEVNLVMDKIANRPRGFAFLRYATEEDSQKAIDGMHGKFLDGRVIFVEIAKPRSELRQRLNQNTR